MKRNQYHDEKIRRYADELEKMSSVELAHVGIKNLKIAFGFSFAVIPLLSLWLYVKPNAMIAVLLMAIICSLPFMVFEWFLDKGTIKRNNHG